MKKIFLLSVLGFFFCGYAISESFSQNPEKNSKPYSNYPYAFEEEWIEVMFSGESKVRIRNGNLTDLTTRALLGVDDILNELQWHTWQRLTDLPETTIDNWETNGERNTGEDIYNLNNIYRLKIPKGNDTWKIAERLEALPGIYLAKPVPKPVPLPNPGNYQSQQGYLNPAANNPTGVDALYAWTQTGGTGTGVTICDVEYSWNYNHADITKALGSQINPNTITDPFNDNNHGTAVLGELVSDNNGWGTTGICYGAGLKTCGTYWGGTWNPAGAIYYAISSLYAGDVILLEQQWDYTGSGGYVPLEWYTNTTPNAQTNNAVYAAIVNAIANGIHVVEAGGNGNINTGNMAWYGNSGAIIVGAGGVYTGGTYIEGNLQRLSFSSYGPRFDLQGWGENVFTTGYGTYYNAQGPNYYYRADFNGTSSASPIVAGALACVEGYYFANVSATPPTPANMRTWLATYGTAQITPPVGNIGPRPDIKATMQSFVVATMDFGDAPDGPYPTLMASNGARHTNTGLSLGPLIDVEFNGQPNGTATGDDINPAIGDDEDGVMFTSLLTPGQLATVQVMVNMPCILDAWVDFNKMNAWADPGEQIFVSVPLTGGMNLLSFLVPANAMPFVTFARFRVSGQGGLQFFGYAPNGEVEDYQVMIELAPQPELDFGDAPDPLYPTLLASNGARHTIDQVTYLGPQVDGEPDGQPDPMALGDDMDIMFPPPNDDEDGVFFMNPWIPNQPASLNVLASVQGFLNVWVDFNGNGSWADPGDQVFIDVMLIPGPNMLTFNVPGNTTVGSKFARFRFCTLQGLGFLGPAPNGEVEDYAVNIEPQPDQLDWGDAPDPTYPTLNVNGGASHIIDGITYLGLQIDGEPDGQQTLAADGDDIANLDDEDGVVFMWPVAKGNPCKIKVTASVGNALFNCWIDFNADGDWADANEQVFMDINLVAGDNYLTFITPGNVVAGSTYARCRFSHQPALSYTGPASDGEVEDYKILTTVYGDLKWSQPADPLFPGLHATDMSLLADDWKCNGEVVTDLHWWGNYEMSAQGLEKRGAGINHFILKIYANSNCLPANPIKSYIVPFNPLLEINTGLINNEGSPIYKYDFLLPEPFIQVKDTTYWFSVQAMSNNPVNPPSWRWQEANRWFYPILCGAATNGTGVWQTITWPTPGSMVKYTDLAFEITSWIVDTLYLQNISVTAGQILCYDANNVIVVAGSGTTFTVNPGASATMIAGQKIIYMPGTSAIAGCYMHGYISTTGQFCPRLPVMTGTETEPENTFTEVSIGKTLRAYPNPTTGSIFLELTNQQEISSATVEVYGMMGDKILSEKYPPQKSYELSLALHPKGVYLVRVITGNETRMVKVVLK